MDFANDRDGAKVLGRGEKLIGQTRLSRNLLAR
jgi:hypothetical protein